MNNLSKVNLNANVPQRHGMLSLLWSRMLGRLLRLSLNETKAATRGFQVDLPQARERIEEIGAAFAWGYNHAIKSCSLDELALLLSAMPRDNSGFGFEGAAMGLAMTDWLTPGRRQFERFVAGPAQAHEYMAWVGLGWSFARLPIAPLRALRRYRSINKWLALDGYGFHQGYFSWQRFIILQQRPKSLDESALCIFDQGLGRSMWFVFGANPILIANAIGRFDPARQSELWAGVGLAATYAGGVGQDRLQKIMDASGPHAAALRQGAVFAAQARQRADNAAPHAKLACKVFLGLDLPEAAEIACDCLPTAGDDMASYQRWRLAIQDRCRDKGCNR